MFRRRRDRQVAVDLADLGPAWRPRVEDAVSARQRFNAARERLRPGPVRDRLDAMTVHVDEALRACLETARRAQAAETALAGFDADRATAELKDARRRLETARGRPGSDTAELEAEVDGLAARHAALHRTLNGVEEARRRLRLLNVRLDAAVAQALELSLRPADPAGTERVDAELQGVVSELASLGSALDELGP